MCLTMRQWYVPVAELSPFCAGLPDEVEYVVLKQHMIHRGVHMDNKARLL